VADVQPAAGISFSKIAANQASCPSTLQATKKSTSLTVSEDSPLCPSRGGQVHTIHSVAHTGIRAAKRKVSARFVWNIVPDPWHFDVDPDPDPDSDQDPAIFVIDLQNAKKKLIKNFFSCLLLFEGTFTSFYKDKKS
jgi:hypothetical protein